MSLILSGSDGVSDIDGTASTPAIRGTDANTGIFFPATDTIAFAEGGTESMRLDSSSRVLIGTTNFGGGLTLAKSDTNFKNGSNAYPFPSGNSYLQVDASSTNGQNNWIGINGEYGVSTGSANILLQANFNNTTQQAGNYIGSEATSATSAVLTFGRMIGGATTGTAASKSEAMRIDSSGNLLVGTTTSGGTITAERGSGFIQQLRSNANGADYIQFFNTATSAAVGSITRSGGSNVAYNTSSDYRLKENIAPMTGALAKVSQLKPVTYTWKADGSDGQGFIAHELAEVVPEAVTGEKDAVEIYTDEEGNEQTRIKPQGIDTSFLVATLTAAIQELNAKVEAQAAEIAALKNQPTE